MLEDETKKKKQANSMNLLNLCQSLKLIGHYILYSSSIEKFNTRPIYRWMIKSINLIKKQNFLKKKLNLTKIEKKNLRLKIS